MAASAQLAGRWRAPECSLGGYRRILPSAESITALTESRKASIVIGFSITFEAPSLMASTVISVVRNPLTSTNGVRGVSFAKRPYQLGAQHVGESVVDEQELELHGPRQRETVSAC